MRIGVIGCGTIASAVVQGIAADGHRITVSRRSARTAEALASSYENVSVADNQIVVDSAEVIFLGLIAETASDILGALHFRKDQKVISFMAGATLDEVGAMVQPAQAVAIVMPFPGIAQGGSPVMMQGDVELVATLFGAKNTLFSLRNDDEMLAYLAAQAVLSPVVRMVGGAADWLGERVTDKAQGEAFLRLLVASSLSTTGCGALIEVLNTPGGYNQRLRLHMEASGMRDALKTGLDKLSGAN